MAIIWQPKKSWFAKANVKPKAKVTKTTPVEATKAVVQVAPVTIKPVAEVKQDPSMKAILARMEAQDKEIALLKNPTDPNKDAKVIYAWPRKYSFSLWAGVPVLSVEYFKKDEAADLVYQNQNWLWVENQYARLSLLWGKTIETSNYLYNKNKSKSEHQFADTNKNELWDTTYTFNDPTHGEFTILSSKFIN